MPFISLFIERPQREWSGFWSGRQVDVLVEKSLT